MYIIFIFIFAIFFRIKKFIYIANNFNNLEFDRYFVIKFSIKLFDNRFELTFLVLKIDLFRKNIIVIVIAINDVDYIVISIQYLLDIIDKFARDFLFYIRLNEFFIVVIIIKVFCVILKKKLYK